MTKSAMTVRVIAVLRTRALGFAIGAILGSALTPQAVHVAAVGLSERVASPIAAVVNHKRIDDHPRLSGLPIA